MLPRFLTGLTVGLLITAVFAIFVILPAAVVIRLFWGVWPNQRAWLWIGGVLASQTLTTALRYALRRPKTPFQNQDTEL